MSIGDGPWQSRIFGDCSRFEEGLSTNRWSRPRYAQDVKVTEMTHERIHAEEGGGAKHHLQVFDWIASSVVHGKSVKNDIV